MQAPPKAPAPPRNVLLTLGRMPKGLDLARGLADAGLRVFVADPHKTHVSKYSKAVHRSFQVTAPDVSPDGFRRDLLQIVESQDISLVIPVSEESIYAARIIDGLPDGVRFFGPGFETARALHDKCNFIEQATVAGLTAPKTALLGSADAQALVATGDVIVKPRHASAGIGVVSIAKGGRLPAATERPSVVQQKLTGRLVTSFAVAIDGKVLACSVYQGAIFAGSVAIAFERAPDSAAAEAWTAAFAAATKYTGFLSFDIFIEADGRAYAIECNPRLTSGVHFLETADIAKAIVADGTPPPIRLRPRTSFQHFWPCLGVTEMSIFSGRFRRNLKTFLASADVTWSARDPLPFVMMNFCSLGILKKCLTEKMSLGEATITDVEWREPAMPAGAPVSAAAPGT